MTGLSTTEDVERMVKDYQDALIRFAVGIVGNQTDAQDVVQAAFIKAWEKRSGLRRPESMKSWLYQITYRQAVDLLRRRQKTEAEELDETLPAAEAETGISEETAKALESLKPLDRAIVEERILEEMTYEEMARIHHLPKTTIRSRYSRARKKLQVLLTKSKEEFK